ncbi:peptidyl-Lys metalloendopeptidase [Ceratobasidium sp. AG-Ba]|nr:peptidyl-Lys metalloendopeptidase [Ceratobasidium sp. AG-Ba]
MFDYVDSSGSLNSVKAVSNSFQFRLTGLLAAPNQASLRSLRNTTYNGCDAAQKASILEAAQKADQYVNQARTYFQVNGAPTIESQLLLSVSNFQRNQFTKWFGAFDKDRFNLVASHFEKIALQGPKSSYDCKTCHKPDVFAYVFASDPSQTIYLCPRYWKSPLAGVNSRAGTLVHENSHFKVNGGTEDYEYGVNNCTALAQESPEAAVMNADNHEYFLIDETC